MGGQLVRENRVEPLAVHRLGCRDGVRAVPFPDDLAGQPGDDVVEPLVDHVVRVVAVVHRHGPLLPLRKLIDDGVEQPDSH